VILILSAIGVVSLYKTTARAQELHLPFPWYWDMARILVAKYKKSDSHPPFFFKHVKEGEDMDLLKELLNKLDFGGICITKAYAIVSPILAGNLSNARIIQKSRMLKNPEQFLNFRWKHRSFAQLRQKTLDYYYVNMRKWVWNEHLDISDSPVIPFVHGTDERFAWRIAAEGFAALSTLDIGFYGKGIYFSSSALYTIPYFQIKSQPAILICLCIPGNPYPVIEHRKSENSLVGKPLIDGFQSHYVVVTKNGYPFKEEHYENEDECIYDELILNQEAQVAPIFLLKVDAKNLVALGKPFERVVPDVPPQEGASSRKYKKDVDLMLEEGINSIPLPITEE